jgi:serine/threonine-protein kinase
MGPATLEHIDLLHCIACGTGTRLWYGMDRRDERSVCVKTIAPEHRKDTDARSAIEREAAILAELDHPSIARLLSAGKVSRADAEAAAGKIVVGAPFLVLELLEGGTLTPWCGRLTWPEIQEVLAAVLRALDHIHAKGLLHLDIKPANVMMAVDDEGIGSPRLVDFGAARRNARSSTSLRSLYCTPAYVAPERIGQSNVLGPSTDLYSVGCLAYALAAGRPPFQGKRVEDVLWQHLFATPAPLEDDADIPAAFESWLEMLLAKDPRDRFQCAATALEALEALGDAAPMRPATSSGDTSSERHLSMAG